MKSLLLVQEDGEYFCLFYSLVRQTMTSSTPRLYEEFLSMTRIFFASPLTIDLLLTIKRWPTPPQQTFPINKGVVFHHEKGCYDDDEMTDHYFLYDE